MEIIAKSKHVRITPRKMRLVVDAIRGLPLSQTLAVLENINKRAAKPILLTIKQAIGNAVNNFGLGQDSLQIKRIQVGEGPTLKRWRAVSRGRARRINKRTSHISLLLEGEERVKSKEKREKMQSKGKKQKEGKKG